MAEPLTPKELQICVDNLEQEAKQQTERHFKLAQKMFDLESKETKIIDSINEYVSRKVCNCAIYVDQKCMMIMIVTIYLLYFTDRSKKT